MISRLRSSLGVLLVAYVLLASLYSVVTPIFEASDELWHYPTVKYLADHGLALPVQDPIVQTAWRQEGSQPPLYYMLGAILTSWIDTSDLDKARKLNPHADIGIVVPDGNVNMVVHDPAVESFPWHGSVLAVHIVRFLSVLLGAVTVAMTYLLTVELFPGRRWLAIAAAAFTAFNPMFLFISGSVNNDNLSNALASVLLVLVVRLLKRTDSPPLRDLVLIGIVTGAAMLAKLNIAFMIPLIALSLAVIAYRFRDWRPFVIGGIVTGGLTIAIAGWWYFRNTQLYGDPTGLNMFVRIVGPRNVTPNWAQLWSERHTFLMSYWGFFGGVNVPMPDIVYAIFNIIAGLAAVGLVIGLVRWLRCKDRRINWPILLGTIFTMIWVVGLFASLLRWTSMTWASQGRLMFTAIAPLSMWLAVGLWKLSFNRRTLLVLSLGWFLLISSGLGLFVYWLVDSFAHGFEVYSSPCSAANDVAWKVCRTVTFREPQQIEPSLEMVFDPVVPDIQAGDYLKLFLDRFRVTGEFSRDWSVFIHLENEDGVIIAQRDVYLRQGEGATTLLKKGDDWYNFFAIRIPDYAYAPQELKVYLGFYSGNDRLIPEGQNVVAGNQVDLGTLKLLPRASSLNVPNPMSVNFGGEAELVGYDVSGLLLYPGEKVTVTFYWRALHPLAKDYHVFTQILNPGTTSTFGGHDSMPGTTAWKPGEIIKDVHTFNVSKDAAPGTWQIQVGLYEFTPDNQIRRLNMIAPDGGEGENVALLTRVKINPLPEPF